MLNSSYVLLFIDLPLNHKDFISDFSDFFFLSVFIPCLDNILILGDFNIHVCCPSRPLVKEFNHLLESFGLSQCVVGPTHERGHTLSLVLTLGFSVGSVQIADTVFSDHKTVLFNPIFFL